MENEEKQPVSKDAVAENDNSNCEITTETTPLFGENHKRHLLNSPSLNHDPEKLKKRLTFAAFALLYFTMTASYSVIAPFFPTEAKAKGASGNVIGLIFGIFAFVIFIFSPISGILVPILGVRFLLFIGTFIAGVAEFLFGFLNKMPDGDVFIAFSLVLRAFDGVGGAAAMTAAIACLAQCFPDNVGVVMGGLELFTGIGLTVGPLIGGVLYEYGGFGMPFFVLAGLMLVSIPPIAVILPTAVEQAPANTQTTSDVTMKNFLKIPSFDIIVSTIIFGGMAIGIVEPTLAIHLKEEFNVTSSTQVGLIFFLLCGSYALLAPLSGWIADKTRGRVVMTFGCFLLAVGFFLLGPVPFSFMPKSLTQVYIAMAVIGMSLGPFFTPAISELESIAKARGFPDDLTTHGLISGIYGAAFNIGSFIGPTCSGVIMEHVSFTWLCTGFGLIILLEAFILLGLTLCGGNESVKLEKVEVADSAQSYSHANNIQI